MDRNPSKSATRAGRARRVSISEMEGESWPRTLLGFSSATDASTASVWRNRSAPRCCLGGRTSSVSRCLTDSQTLERRVFRIARGPGHKVITGCIGCSVRSALARYCLHTRDRESVCNHRTFSVQVSDLPFKVIRMQYTGLRSTAAVACPPRNWTSSDIMQDLHRA